MYKLYNENKKIPFPLALIVLVSIFTIPLFLFSKTAQQKVQTNKNAVFQKELANITSNGATIYWRTDAATVGLADYSQNGATGSKTAYDDRDLVGQPLPRSNHYITLRDLRQATTYFVTLISTDGREKKQSTFSFITAQNTGLSSNRPPLYGKVVDGRGLPVENVVVIANIKKTIPVATISKGDGTFLLSYCCFLRNETLEQFNPKDDDVVSIDLIGEKGLRSTVVTIVSQSSPLAKTIVLGENEKLVMQSQPVPEGQAVLGVSQENQQQFNPIDIFYPAPDAVIPGVKPIFKGRALKGAKVTLIIESNKRVVDIIAGENGLWQYTPSFNLEAGSHQVTMETLDDHGRKVQEKRTFTISKSGEAVLGEATPSAILTPTIIPTEIPLPTVITTTEPVITLTPTPPVTGMSFVSFSLFSLAFILLGGGLLLVF